MRINDPEKEVELLCNSNSLNNTQQTGTYIIKKFACFVGYKKNL